MKPSCWQGSNQLRVAAAGAVAAVTMLWIGSLSPAFFQAGTVLLVICLVPLSRGLGLRGGSLVGLLLSVVWVAACMGVAPRLHVQAVCTGLNLFVVSSMMLIGGLAGVFLQPALDHAATQVGTSGGWTVTNPVAVERSAGDSYSPTRSTPADNALARAITMQREWLAAWDRANSPWPSFDQHIREIARIAGGLRRVRCYHVCGKGKLVPLNHDSGADAPVALPRDLVEHVLLTGKRFAANAPGTGPLVQELAAKGPGPVVWALPIREGNVSIGLVTAEAWSAPQASDGLDTMGDMIEEFWLHIHHLEELRMARQTDRASGLINRTDLLPAIERSLAQSYDVYEPVVVMVVCLEGLRSLDDASRWARRDQLIERVGQVIASGLRKDDVVGRFNDSQFVAVLRRLDLPLAELISRKLLGDLSALIAEFDLDSLVTARAGLSGSGFSHPGAETLLSHALSALSRARATGTQLVSESPDKLAERAGA